MSMIMGERTELRSTFESKVYGYVRYQVLVLRSTNRNKNSGHLLLF